MRSTVPSSKNNKTPNKKEGSMEEDEGNQYHSLRSLPSSAQQPKPMQTAAMPAKNSRALPFNAQPVTTPAKPMPSADEHVFRSLNAAAYRGISIAPRAAVPQASLPTPLAAKAPTSTTTPSSVKSPTEFSAPTSTSATQQTLKGNNSSAKTEEKITTTPMPSVLEKFSHCYLTGSLELLVSKISAHLSEADLDFEFSPEGCKWSACSYLRNRAVSFRIFLYPVSSSLYLLELQRRAGCSAHFALLFRRVFLALLAQNLVCDEKGRKLSQEEGAALVAGISEQPFEPLPLPPGYEDDFVFDTEMFLPLLEMARSEFIEAQREAMHEIANQAASDKARGVLLQTPGILESVVKGLTSEDAEIRRCAASAVEAFSKDKELQTVLEEQQQLVRRICELLDTPKVAALDRETRRVLCRATCNLAPAFRERICQCNGVKVFESLATQSVDQKTREVAQNVLLAVNR